MRRVKSRDKGLGLRRRALGLAECMAWFPCRSGDVQVRMRMAFNVELVILGRDTVLMPVPKTLTAGHRLQLANNILWSLTDYLHSTDNSEFYCSCGSWLSLKHRLKAVVY